jgi:hypothetical protein
MIGMAGRIRRFAALGLGASLLVLALPAATHAGVEAWDGNWTTHNKFGNPSLHLVQEPASDPGPQVHGTFRDDNGAQIGKIHGNLSSQGHVWTGHFHNESTGDKGRFEVEINGDLVTFEGSFRFCDSGRCSKSYKWTGEHA